MTKDVPLCCLSRLCVTKATVWSPDGPGRRHPSSCWLAPPSAELVWQPLVMLDSPVRGLGPCVRRAGNWSSRFMQCLVAHRCLFVHPVSWVERRHTQLYLFDEASVFFSHHKADRVELDPINLVPCHLSSIIFWDLCFYCSFLSKLYHTQI